MAQGNLRRARIDEDTGALTGLLYSDSTPDVTFDTYDRLGRLTQVTDGAGIHTSTFNAVLQLEKIVSFGPATKAVAYGYETGPSADLPGRPALVSYGPTGDPDGDYLSSYAYDTKGRLNRVTGPGLPAYGAVYSFEADSALVSGWTFNSAESTVIAETIRDFEDFRDLVTSIENKFGATTVSKYAYLSDNLGKRTRRIDSGSVFTAQTQEAFGLFGYNDRNELTAQNRYAGTDPGDTTNPIGAEQHNYDYDPIGNRTESATAAAFPPTTYTANNLNQYIATAAPAETFTHDNRGNMTADGSNTYTWDAENRLVEVEPLVPVTGSTPKLVFEYDYRGRRVRKAVYEWTGSAWPGTPNADSRFVYDNWNLLGELDALDSNEPVARYTWGLDLSGQSGNASVGGIHGAGGIGGLLAVHDHISTDDYLYFHDANGNVGQLIDHSGTVVAHYEYDPYGGEVHASGSYAASNPFRFSTKYLDAEIACASGPDGLYYYGFRYYSPRLGRWLNRDRIFQDSLLNLLDFNYNAPLNWIDPDGAVPQQSQATTCPDSAASRPADNPTTQSARKSRVPGTFDVLLGGSQQKGASTAALVRYTPTKHQRCCCKTIQLLQIVETEVIRNLITPNDIRPPHIDGLKDNGWPFYPGQTVGGRTGMFKDGSCELDDAPGFEDSFVTLSQSFETCAICTNDKNKRFVLGCRKWGHYQKQYKKNPDGRVPVNRWGAGLVLPPQLPSVEFFKVLAKEGVKFPTVGDCKKGE